MGIADLDTPQRLAATQRATAVQMHQMDVHQDSSQDDTEHDADDNTHKAATKSRLHEKILQTQNQNSPQVANSNFNPLLLTKPPLLKGGLQLNY